MRRPVQVVADSDQAKNQVSAAAFLYDENIALLSHALATILQRWPDHFENDVPQEFYRFVGSLDPAFRQPRSHGHLAKLFCSHYLMRKALGRAVHLFPQKRGLKIRLVHARLQSTFGTKAVLGLVIAVSLKEEQERFGERHIFSAVQKALPAAEVVKGSFYASQLGRDPVRLLYLELGKKDGSRFSLSEIKTLSKELPEELPKRIETLDPATFNVHREEEVLKNIAFLQRELVSTPGLPQTMVFFESQTPDDLCFRVILVRTLRKDTPALSKCFDGLPVQFIADRTKHLQNREASVFRLRIPIEPALVRTDFSINLYLARETVLALLKQALGEVRDYNGGLFSLQRDLFTKFKGAFPKIAKKDPDLLENFFHALEPSYMQAMVHEEALGALFRLFLKAAKGKKDHAFMTLQRDFFLLAMIRTEDASCKEHIAKTLEQEDDLVSVALQYGGAHFLGYIYNSPEKHKREMFRWMLRKGLRSWRRKAERVQSLKLSVQNLPLSLDPRLGGDEVSKTILKMLFEGLMRIGKNGKPEYGAAEEVTISDDQKTYIFSLRKCYWNNGEKITAHDFAYAWKKALLPSFSSAFSHLFYPIRNARAAKEGSSGIEDVGIEVLDSKTLKVELEHPCPYFLELTAHPLYSPIQSRIDALHPHWPMQEGKIYVCNGPFQLKKSHMAGLELTKNPHYWDSGQVKLGQVLISQANAAAACSMYKNNEIDWLGRPLRVWNSLFTKTSSDVIETISGKGVYWAVFNVQCFLLQNLKLRQAFALAVQRQPIVDSIQNGTTAAFSPLPFDQRQYFFQEENLQKARVLFEEALKELQLSRKTFPILTLIHNTGEMPEKTVEMLTKQWEKAFDIRCEAKSYSWKEMFHRMSEGNFDMGLMPWKSSIGDSTYTLNAFRYSKDKINFSKWENTEYQLMLHQADHTCDLDQRRAYLTTAEQILIREIPVISLFDKIDPYVRKKNLSGVLTTPTGAVDFRNACFTKPIRSKR